MGQKSPETKDFRLAILEIIYNHQLGPVNHPKGDMQGHLESGQNNNRISNSITDENMKKNESKIDRNETFSTNDFGTH